jgi:hypothetical protein
MTADLAHVGMPKPDRVVRLLCFEAVNPIALTPVLVDTVLSVL